MKWLEIFSGRSFHNCGTLLFYPKSQFVIEKHQFRSFQRTLVGKEWGSNFLGLKFHFIKLSNFHSMYRRRRRFATAATAPRIFGIFFTTILNIKPEKNYKI